VRKLTPTPEELKRSSWVSIGVKTAAPHPLSKLGVWGVSEATDHGLIAVKSSIDDYWLGLGWAKAKRLMARSTIPCLHSEPTYPEIGPSRKARVTGRLYFHEASLNELERRFRRDEEDEILRVEVT